MYKDPHDGLGRKVVQGEARNVTVANADGLSPEITNDISALLVAGSTATTSAPEADPSTSEEPTVLAKVGAEPRYGLERIFVVNSYTKQKIRVVDVKDFAHIGGSNGQGKTSLLRLLPLFYGEAPSKMVRPNGNVLKPLREYIFDTSSSYLVFEYVNEDGPKLAILYYSQAGAACYTLCDGRFDKSLFVVNGEFIDSRHLNGHLRTQGRLPTPALGNADYQKVLQRNFGMVRGTDLRRHMERFALPSTGSLTGVEKIVSGMFFKGASFANLKHMAYSVLSENDADNISAGIKMKSLKLFFSNFNAYRSLARYQQQFFDAREAHVAMIRSATARNQTGIKINIYHAYLLDRVAALKKAIQGTNNALERERAIHEENMHAAGLKIAELDAGLTVQNKLVDEITDEERAYERDDIHGKRAKVAEIPQLEATVSNLAGALQRLRDSQLSIEEKYLREREQVGKQYEEARVPLLEQKEDIQARARQARLTINAEYAREEEFLNTSMDDARAALSAKETQAYDNRQKLSEELGEIDITYAFRSKRDAVEQRKERLGRNLEELQDAHQRAAAEHEKAIADFRQIEHMLQQEQATLDRLRAEQDQKMTLHAPDPQSALHFLRKHKPDWHMTIGKLVKEDVLLATDLNPQIVDDNAYYCYGVALDLTGLKSSIASQEQKLLADLQDLDAQITQTEDRMEKHWRDLAAADELRKAAKQRRDGAEAQIAAKRDAVAEAVKEIDAITVAANADVRQRKADKRVEIDRAKDTIDLLKVEAEALNKRAAQTRAALKTQYQQKEKQSDLLASNELKIVDDLLAAAKKTRDDTMASLKTAQDEELRARGMDVDALATLKGSLESAKTAHDNAINYRRKVEEHARWLDSRPAQREKAQQKIANLTNALEEQTAARDKADREFKVYVESVARTRNQDQMSLNSHSDKLAETEKLQSMVHVRDLGASIAAPFEPAGATHESLRSDFRHHADKYREHHQKRNSAISSIHRAFFAAADGTHVRQFANNMPSNIIETPTEDNIEDIIAVMSDWFTAGHEQSRDSINFECKSVCGHFVHFHDELLGFRENINNLSRRLQNNLNSGMVFRKIRSVKVRMVSRVEHLSYWDELDQVVREYRFWQDNNDCEGIPPDPLLHQLEALSVKVADGKLSETPDSLIDLQLLVDDGTVKIVNNESELANVSSTGLTQMAMIIIFIAFINSVRTDPNVWLTWAMDEIGTIDDGNTVALSDLLLRHRIILVSAAPGGKPEVLSLFKTHYEVLDSFELSRTQPEIMRDHHVKRSHQAN